MGMWILEGRRIFGAILTKRDKGANTWCVTLPYESTYDKCMNYIFFIS